jgi:deazaflavin-dependent oxidoreductase (nitroreductase family)
MPSRGRARYRRRLAWVLGCAALAYVLPSVIHVVVWRTRWQPGIEALRRFHKSIRRIELRSAGKRSKSTAAVHHTGRKSGRGYVTPVWAHRVGDRFFVGLPYGTGVDWCRNVIAAGGCALAYDGARYDVIAPVIVPVQDAPPRLAGTRRHMLELMGIESFLRLDIAPPSNEDGARAADMPMGPGHSQMLERGTNRDEGECHAERSDWA